MDTVLNSPDVPVPVPVPVPKPTELKLTDVKITDENVALNMMVSFLSIANKRGAFGIDESAKIWECVQMFNKPV